MLIKKREHLAFIDGDFQTVPVTSILGLIMAGKCYGDICLTMHGRLYGYISLKSPKYTDDNKSLVVDMNVPKILGWRYKDARDIFSQGK